MHAMGTEVCFLTENFSFSHSPNSYCLNSGSLDIVDRRLTYRRDEFR